MPLPNELPVFLNLIIPFDDPKSAQLYKCVSTITPDWKNPGARGFCKNIAVKGYDETIRLIEERARYRQTEVYIALGLGRMAKTETYQDGYLKAIRTAQNMVSLNCLYCDVDVGKNGCYATGADAELGLQQFLQASGMPEPSMLVRSGGGGFHVYWCTAEPMPLIVWQPLADGLRACAQQHNFKIDPGITIDSARILRVPTTLNHKYDPPRLVTLDAARSSFQQYTVDGLSSVLSQYVTVQRSKTGTTAGPAPNASNWAQNFGANVNERKLPRLSIDKIAEVCPMTEQTLANGGAGKDQPQWSDDMFLAAWTSDPTDAAHRLSKGHSTYVPADTDQKLAEKIGYVSSGKGWPSCKSFKHAACADCPLLQYDKSPIFFAHRAVPIDQPTTAKYAVDPLIPQPYYRNENDHIITSTENGHVDVMQYPILDGGIDPTSGELVIKTLISGKERWGSIAFGSNHSGRGMCELLCRGTKNGILIRGGLKQQNAVKDFIMAWVQHLQNAKKMVAPSSFGWIGNDFVFGDEKYTPDGPQSVYRGSTIDEKYQRIGELQPWTDAMPLVYGSPPLEVMVASAFAAPLVELTCDNSVVLSLYSYDSGVGKTTAMKLAQAVWGMPREGMSMFNDKPNAVMQKVVSLKNLPIYWDEVKTKEQVDETVNIIFSVIQGRSKARLTRDSRPMEIGKATTLMAVASNTGIVNAVVRNTEGTEAGGLRVFEFEAGLIANKLSNSEALIIPLNGNYGVAGAMFADFIVRKRAMVKQLIGEVEKQLQHDCQFETKERFWKSSMVTVLAGAILANTMELTRFDVAAIQDYLYGALHIMRDSSETKTYSNVKDVLAEMLADTRNRNLLITDTVPTGAGSPITNAAEFFDPQKTGDMWIQKGKYDNRIMARVKPFQEWLLKHGYKSPKQVIHELEQQYFIKIRRAAIGTGVTGFAALQDNASRARCYDMTPLVPPTGSPDPDPDPSHNPFSPSSNFG